MSKQTINIGASPNDGTGTPLRTSFDYTNQNFTELYTALGGGVGLPGATTQVIFNDGGTNLAGDAGLVYNKTTDALTVAGLVTAGSATITGALVVDTTTLVVDATNDRVGIGTASPTSALHVNLAEVSSAAGTTANITNTTSGGNRIAALRLNNLSNQWNIRAYGAVTDDLRFGAGATGSEVDYLTVNTSGNVTVSTGNVVMGTSGKGIDFAATASGSGTMTSELLNDYEEGTWTGTLYGGTTTPGSPVQATGKYTKIGRQVSITIYFNNVDTTGYVGSVYITGLPFAEDGSRANGTLACYNFDFSSGTSLFANVGVTTLYCTSALTNSNWRDVLHSAGAGRYLQANVVYYV